MHIISGQLPTENMWRVMVLLEQDSAPTLSWQLAHQLAQANSGAFLLTAVLENEADAAAIQARLHAYKAAHDDDSNTIEILIVVSKNLQTAVREIVVEAHVKLLLTEADSRTNSNLNNMPCTVGALRYKTGMAPERIEKILLPTSGGPGTAHALTFLKNLPRRVEIRALYISRTDQGLNEEALGRSRLEQMVTYADAEDRCETKVARYISPIEGIVQQAKGFDLMVMGASRESSIDQALFGNVVNSVVRRTNTPVLVVRQARSRTNEALSNLDWQLQRVVPRLTQKEREATYVKIRTNARPDLDYFVLITLSAAIASLGLIANSTAVVIGAMLVAPLMSPIIAAGLSLILGDMRFLRRSLGAAVTGVLIAILVGLLNGWINPGNDMTSEVMARTAPNLLDLGIAIFSGLAGAFALAYPDALGALPGVSIAVALVPPLSSIGIALSDGDWRRALGALLLFATNFVAITLASALVFFVFGFRPNPIDIQQRRAQARSTRLALFLLALITLALGAATVSLIQERGRNAQIEATVREQVTAIMGDDARLMNDVDDPNDPLVDEVENGILPLNLVVRSSRTLSTRQIETLQTAIYDALASEIALEEALQISVVHIRTSVPEESAE